jgi:cytochrome P450
MAQHSSSIALTVPGPVLKTPWENITHLLRFSQDSIGFTRQLFQTYGHIVSLKYGGGTNVYSPLPNCPGTVFTYGAEFVRQVATQHDIYFKHPLSGRLYRHKDDSDRTEPLKHFVVGLFGVNRDQHRQHRQLMMPAFHKQQVEQYRDDIVVLTQSTLDQLQDGQLYDISKVMRLLTMRIATKTLFGDDIGESGGKVGELLQDSLRLMGSPLMLLPFDLPGLPYHRFLNQIAQLDDEIRNMIAKKRSSTQPTHDVLSLLIQARDEELGRLSEDELLGHAGVIFAAGHETSSNALTWTLFLLSQHPEITADLVDELESVLQGEAPSIAQLAQLPFLERVIKESMRVLPPVPWNGRVTSQATELGGYALPAGTEVFVSITQTHHSPELYAEPERFNPRRWETINPTAYEYNPFSAGPRLCIGASLAMLEVKLVLAMLLQRYRLQLIPTQKVDQTGVIVMSPKYGMQMKVHQLDRQWQQGIGGVKGNIRELVQLPA